MRIFQNIHLYDQHIAMIDATVGKNANFKQRSDAIISLGLNGTHLLHPIRQRDPNAFLTSTADHVTQRIWAIENGFPASMHPHDVLVEQLKVFKPEIFYTQSPGYFPNHVRELLPSLCKMNVCWKAPPDFMPGLSGFDLLVNNFPNSFAKYQKVRNLAVGFFTPSFDPIMETLCFNPDREYDVAFAGGYSRRHRQRAKPLEKVMELQDEINIACAFSVDRATRIADTPIGYLPYFSQFRMPNNLRRAAKPPVFGRDMYAFFSKSKIVLNGAIDVADGDRGNIRCFEVLGLGALMISDEGNYPPGFENKKTMLTYSSPDQLQGIVRSVLKDEGMRLEIAAAGLKLLRETYSSENVWKDFLALIHK